MHKNSRDTSRWIEKATLLHVVEPIADEFCRRVVVCKGYGSITFQAQFYERAMEAIGYGQVPTILYFGDWDPSGVNMIQAAMETIHNELGLSSVEYYRCGINPDHFHELTADPIPIKYKDSRAKGFIKEHGTTAYELDAFHPKRLQELVRESIEVMTDNASYYEQKARQEVDKEMIQDWRDGVFNVGVDLAVEKGILKV